MVLKIGSAVIAPGGRPDESAFQRLADGVAAVRSKGANVVLVSSGAVASGFRSLGLTSPPKQISRKQAAAAVGQQKLMASWAAAFGRHGTEVAQVLYTSEDLDSRARFLNARRTLLELLEAGVVPIVNENDSVSFAEIRVGDNDRLSALTAGLIDADLLLILSSVPGLLDSSGKVVPRVDDLADSAKHLRTDKSSVGTGGMVTKLEAAGIAASWGVATVIASGAEVGVALRVIDGEELGTFFPAAASARSAGRARKGWIGASARPRGTILVDAGCEQALLRRGASLLPSGITGVDGEFSRGSVVAVAGPDRAVMARGIAAYSSDDLRKIQGLKGSQIAATLGYSYADEAIHRDDLVIDGRAARSAGHR